MGLSRGSVVRYGFELVTKIYEKFDKKCNRCGSQEYLSIHHIDNQGIANEKKGLKPNNQEENLELVCASCHGKITATQQWGDGERKFVGREKEYQKEWRAKNKEKVLEYAKKYRAKIKRVENADFRTRQRNWK